MYGSYQGKAVASNFSLIRPGAWLFPAHLHHAPDTRLVPGSQAFPVYTRVLRYAIDVDNTQHVPHVPRPPVHCARARTRHVIPRRACSENWSGQNRTSRTACYGPARGGHPSANAPIVALTSCWCGAEHKHELTTTLVACAVAKSSLSENKEWVRSRMKRVHGALKIV